VLIKASAGGGGKGMRRVDRAEDFTAALAACQREAKSSFGDDHVLVERYVTRPRHIEIQVFADSHGNGVHLFERDCSVQRRHQKVLEEAPAPGLSAERRAEMGAAAIAAAKAVGYVGAGTVEFIVEPVAATQADGAAQDLRFYFMEMNTRLQVEHPVTEAITGVDLVEWQLRIAAGQALPLTQADLKIDGHAIEARICAENPDAGFLPATGRLSVLRWPPHVEFQRNVDDQPFHPPAAVRVDTGVVEGDLITPHYDPMIAKLIVWGEDREQALARLAIALQATQIVGPANNVAFLGRVVASTAFAGADLDTALIEREKTALFDAPPLPFHIAAAGVVAHALALERANESADPWSRRDGWRLHGGARRHFDIERGDAAQAVALSRSHDGSARLEIGDESWRFSTESRSESNHELMLDGQRLTLCVHARGETVAVFAAFGSALLREVDAITHAGDSAAGGRLTAPMPGKLIAYLVRPGERVIRGQALAVIEAMKMEHQVTAPRDGVVAECLFDVDDQVSEGAELLRLEVE
jgi:3-methylcrotonyl-CoA carboxylase alpha subunit